MISQRLKYFLATLILLGVTQIYAFADNYKAWFRIQVNAECKNITATGEGKVYLNYSSAANETVGAKSDYMHSENCQKVYIRTHTGKGFTYKSGYDAYNSHSVEVYFLAVPNDGYKFVRWEDASGKVLSTSDVEKGTANVNHTSTNKCPTKSTKGDHEGEHAEWKIEATYYAVFEKIQVEPAVKAISDNESLGNVIYNRENEVGDEITLNAYSFAYNTKFLGWYKDGVLVDKRASYTFTIDESNKGEYVAKFESGYEFFHLVNRSTNRAICGIDNTGSPTNFGSLSLISHDKVQTDVGSIMQIATEKVGSRAALSYDFIIQGFHSRTYYTIPTGNETAIYVTMEHSADNLAWTMHPNSQNTFMCDEGQSSVSSITDSPDFIATYNAAHWYIECMDKDLETRENYFSLDPDKMVQVGDGYYTTLRTAWSVLFDPEQITPYVVTAVDDAAGTFDIEPIEGNIIPAGTAVIVKTDAAHKDDIVMVPTTAAGTVVTATNQLVSTDAASEYYFPGRSRTASQNYKTLTVKDGKLAFGGAAQTTINGNEAYLQVAGDVVLDHVTDITLAELVAKGDTENKYRVTDLTAVRAGEHVIYAKDDNGYAAKQSKGEGEVDLLAGSFKPADEYDQSNWVKLDLGDDLALTAAQISAAEGAALSDVVGVMTDAVNPTISLTAVPTFGTQATVPLNTYITSSFLPSPQTGTDGRAYFMMNPKPMEIAAVTWAVWDENAGAMVVPEKDLEAHNNESGLKGGFRIDMSLNEVSPAITIDDLNDGEMYEFEALIRKESAAALRAPRRVKGDASEISGNYMVYPFNLSNAGIVTAVETPRVEDPQGEPVIYDLMGHRVRNPRGGIYIVNGRKRVFK